MISVLVIVLLFVVVFLSRWREIGHREPFLPPGPPTKFLLGNAKDFPRLMSFVQLTRWAAEYGEIVSLKILNKNMIILNTAPVVKAILDKQGLLSGDRPQVYLIQRAEGVYPVFANLDSRLCRGSRKAYHTFLSSEAIASYLPMQQREYARLIHDIAHSPNDFIPHIKRMMSSILVSLLYGKSLSDFGDSKYLLYFDSARKFAELADPFAHPPLDILPFLKLVPARWAKWKRLCEEVKQIRGDFFDELYEDFETRYNAGERTGSFLEKILDHPTHFDMTVEEIRGLTHVLMDGGVDTSAAFLQSFVLALVCNPACQVKAQSEIDRVIGDNRMPTLRDFEDLPYLRALIKETHRFRTILPGALPHYASKDIQHGEYLIPEGSILIMNTWGIFHDAKIFESPDTFDPERYMKSEFGVKDGASSDGLRDSLPFGAGRRICPGIEMAERTLAINTMNLVWGLSFADKTGQCSMDLNNYHCTSDLSPNPFTCEIKVRDAKRARLIDETYTYMTA